VLAQFPIAANFASGRRTYVHSKALEVGNVLDCGCGVRGAAAFEGSDRYEVVVSISRFLHPLAESYSFSREHAEGNHD